MMRWKFRHQNVKGSDGVFKSITELDLKLDRKGGGGVKLEGVRNQLYPFGFTPVGCLKSVFF